MKTQEVISRLADAGEWIDGVASDPTEIHIQEMQDGISEAIEIIGKSEQPSTGDLRVVLDEKLQKVAHFVFKKADGTEREAFGTINGALLPKPREKYVDSLLQALPQVLSNFDKCVENPALLEQDPDPVKWGLEEINELVQKMQPKDQTPREKPANLITYFDLVSNGWRSCKEENLVRVF